MPRRAIGRGLFLMPIDINLRTIARLSGSHHVSLLMAASVALLLFEIG
jgi:hypothetical protein